MPFSSEGREDGIGLALSGGGFRAVLFHCGALIRLNEVGLLPKVNRISSVSGGSIIAGVLAVNWTGLTKSHDRFTNLNEVIIQPLQSFCSKTLDVGAVLWGAVNPFKTAGDELIDAYRDKLRLGVALTQLPETCPRFVFNSTNYATGVSFRFSKPYCGDYRIGLMKDSGFDVATAVAASSAFPPVFSPITLDVDPGRFERVSGADLFDKIDFRRRLLLADGGVYDNMGLETVWGRYTTVLVSDGGKPFELDATPSGSLAQLARVADIGLNQALALRKRVLIEKFQHGDGFGGTYWGIGTLIGEYGYDQALEVSPAKTAQLAAVRTRLSSLSAAEQEELINWGYAVCDAALQTHVRGHLIAGSKAAEFPFQARPMA